MFDQTTYRRLLLSSLICVLIMSIPACGDDSADTKSKAEPAPDAPASQFEAVKVENHSFEFPAIAEDQYKKKAANWEATYSRSVWHVPLQAYFREDGQITGGDGVQIAYLNNWNKIWQEVGIVEPNTTYKLTVAIGARGNDTPFGTSRIALVSGAVGTGQVLAEKKVVYGTDFPEAKRREFLDFSLTLNSSDRPQLHGDKLFIVLSAAGGGQSNFDNIRLEKKAQPVN